MNITSREENGERILMISGCLDTAATEAFDQAIDAETAQHQTLVLDLSELEFIASSALRKLVAVEKRLAAAGGEIVLMGMNEVVRDVFDVTGLNEVFTIR